MDELAANSEAAVAPESTPPAPRYREVKYRHSQDFPGLLDQLRVTLLVSTYQAGKLAAIGAPGGQLHIRMHSFDQAMGIAVHPHQIAVGARGAVWFLRSAPDIAPRLQPEGQYDGCYLTRRSLVTGNIHGHEMAWAGDELWVVNTRFSCLCTLSENVSFVPRWRPPFITALEATDRCHLNGLALAAGRPKYVTAMAESNEPAGWRPTKAESGCIVDVDTGAIVSRGLAMPHSPRVHGGRLWVLNSGFGSLEAVDAASGRRNVAALMPGYTRGLAFHEHYAFVGLSRIRETAVFGGVPIAEHRHELRCGVGVVDLRAGKTIAYLEFESGVEEIFDVQTLPGTQRVWLTGPHDDEQDVWVVPAPSEDPPPATPR